MNESRLIDKKELIAKHPALGRRKYTLDWLIRTRRIPIVPVGRRIYFDESAISKWIEEKKIPANGGEK